MIKGGKWQESSGKGAHHFLPDGKNYCLCGKLNKGLTPLDKTPRSGQCKPCKNKFPNWYSKNSATATSLPGSRQRAGFVPAKQQATLENRAFMSNKSFTLKGRRRKGHHKPCNGAGCKNMVSKLAETTFCFTCHRDRNYTTKTQARIDKKKKEDSCLLYTSPSPRDATLSRMPSSA